MRRALFALTTIAVVAASGAASADHASTLAAPRLLVSETAAPKTMVTGMFTIGPRVGIFDLRGVQDHPVMRARRDYSLMAALPMLDAPGATTGAAPILPFLAETQTWKVSRDVVLTFPLAITGRNLVTAEIAGTGQLAVMPTGMAKGGVFTFTGEF